jgi:hypothetical protein
MAHDLLKVKLTDVSVRCDGSSSVELDGVHLAVTDVRLDFGVEKYHKATLTVLVKRIEVVPIDAEGPVDAQDQE